MVDAVMKEAGAFAMSSMSVGPTSATFIAGEMDLSCNFKSRGSYF